MKLQRVHVLTAVNAASVSKAGDLYTVKDVCIAVAGIVMNGVLYEEAELAAGAPTLNGKPAPSGHPKNAAGQYINALEGEALLSSYMGGICTNARHTGGRTLVDIVINEKQARAHPDGVTLCDRMDAALNGQNVDPIHVSGGLFMNPVDASGTNGSKTYSRKATAINYNHAAILLHQQGAGTPAEGVGMWLNSAGQAEPVEVVTLDTAPADKRHAGLIGWLRKLVGNESDLSFDQIADALRAALPERAWLREVYQRHVIYVTEDDRLWRRDYAISSDGASVSFTNEPVEVVRRVEYQPVTNQEKDVIKELLIAALNEAGIATDGKTDAQLKAAYDAYRDDKAVKPVQEKLTAANERIAGFEAQAQAAQNAERDALATKLAVNSSLTVEDLKLLPLDRLKAIEAAAKGAAPVIVGNAGQTQASEFKTYDLNAVNGIKE